MKAFAAGLPRSGSATKARPNSAASSSGCSVRVRWRKPSGSARYSVYRLRRWRSWNRMTAVGLFHSLGNDGAAWKLSAGLHCELNLIALNLALVGEYDVGVR